MLAITIRGTPAPAVLVSMSGQDDVNQYSDTHWRCTEVKPANGWQLEEFDASRWSMVKQCSADL
jgi:hypothetical protein